MSGRAAGERKKKTKVEREGEGRTVRMERGKTLHWLNKYLSNQLISAGKVAQSRHQAASNRGESSRNSFYKLLQFSLNVTIM